MMNSAWTIFLQALCGAGCASAIVTILVASKSIIDYSHPGPQVRRVIRDHYVGYVAYSIARLALAVFVIAFILALPGVTVYLSAVVIRGGVLTDLVFIGAGLVSILLLTTYQFCHYLLFEPGTIAANSHYRLSRLYPLWSLLRPARLRAVRLAMVVSFVVCVSAAAWIAWNASRYGAFTTIVALAAFSLLVIIGPAVSVPAKTSRPRQPDGNRRPNILMIGCDTLRADRVIAGQYHRRLTPNIARLAETGSLFTNCFVPIARTAPSLASILTGCWPRKHGIRTNFALPDELSEDAPQLAKILSANGYNTVGISDWVGSDFAKFDFGFDEVDLPEDQWNLKYLIRQGPKDFRLFLSIFTHNKWAKFLLPELYYLPGRPLIGDLGDETIARIDESANSGKPFFINVFMSASHPPFSVGYPDYLKYADREYSGESKFVMSKLVDPMEIIRAQSEPREAFDLDQIINLYDACVDRFDQEVGRLVSHLETNSLIDDTIIVVYSDHGMEFFEKGTWGQGNSALGDHSARIPIVINTPGNTSPVSCDTIVRSVDIAPTLLDYVGLEIPETMDGQSLRNYPGAAQSDRTAYMETGMWIAEPANMRPDHLRYPNILELLEIKDPANGTLGIKSQYRRDVIMARDRVVRRGDWILLYMPLDKGPRYELYNAVDDPDCKADIIADNPAIAEELKRELGEFLEHDVARYGTLP